MAEPKSVAKLAVTLHFGDEEIPVGTLAWGRSQRAAAFEYAEDFAARALPISPFNLKLGPGLRIAPQTPFSGLFGVFADSLPDGWGRLLLDRKLRALGFDPGALTPIDRLAIVGSRGMGALAYQPEQVLGSDSEQGFDIDALAASAAAIQAGISNDPEGTTKDVELLLGANGGSAGARPKILVLRDIEGGYRLDVGRAHDAGTDAWLVKFRTMSDPIEAGRIEHAIALTATAAGIVFPKTATIVGTSGAAHFAVQRFDRMSGRRIHVHTLAGLLGADFRHPSVDYQSFLQATRVLTGRADEVEEAFRRAVFNVMIANRDDHVKNHAFLMGSRGNWRLTPTYDVTPSEGPGGEHSMAVCGEGRRPGRADLMQLAATASIKPATAGTVIDQVETAVASFADHAAVAGLSEAQTAELADQFAAIRHRFRKPEARPSGSGRR